MNSADDTAALMRCFEKVRIPGVATLLPRRRREAVERDAPDGA